MPYMRQYEKWECLEEGMTDGIYEVVSVIATANPLGEVQRVLFFGNPVTMKTVWIPYNSQIKINNETYTVKKGKKIYSGDRWGVGHNSEQSIECIVDKNGTSYSMEKFLGESTEVMMLYEHPLSFISRLFNREQK